MVILPVVGGAVFLSLFAFANPVLGDLLARLNWPKLDPEFFGRVVFAGFVTVVVWGFLRPRLAPALISLTEKPPVILSVGTLILSLVVFNALFALQNGLDLAFLWSGASLPQGVSFADYAHRGAYTLILTALLAAAFVLAALHPASPAAASRWVRILLVIWTAQNLMLVASSGLRLTDYVAAYGLTRLRIAALLWMAVVAAGLLLIVWRMLRGLSTAWLLNTNALVAGIALAASSVVDYGSIAAGWNVRHPPAAGLVDLCYLQQLGAPALVPLVELERSSADPARRAVVAAARHQVLARMTRAQADPYGWTWRNERRLRRVLALNGGRLLPAASPRNPCRHRD
jgi:hypothetical protein